jgi:hypothetical protein
MALRKFACPLTEVTCTREDCTTKVCVTRQLEATAFQESQTHTKERRLRARKNLITGKLELPGKLEDYGL